MRQLLRSHSASTHLAFRQGTPPPCRSTHLHPRGSSCHLATRQEQASVQTKADLSCGSGALAVAAASLLAYTSSFSSPAASLAAGPPQPSPQQAEASGLSRHQESPAGPRSCSSQPAPPLADLAGLFGSNDEDPIDPFTLYGTNFKKYVIEKLEGEKVVSRARGFTVETCVSAIPASSETPEFQGLPTGEKVQAGNDLLCRKAVGPDLKPACVESCGNACSRALQLYEERNQAETGFDLTPKDKERLLKNCRRSCTYECTKSGKAHDFVVPYRR